MAECLGQQLLCHVHWTLLLQECLWQIDTSVRDGERKGSVVAGFDLLIPVPEEIRVMGVSGLSTCWMPKEQIQMHTSQSFPVCLVWTYEPHLELL